MMTKAERTTRNRVYSDPRFGMPGGRIERVWEDPLLNPRYVYR